MPVFSGPENLLESAAKQGIIVLKNTDLKIDDVVVQINKCADVKDQTKWKNFLENIIQKSDDESEIQFANVFLLITQQILQRKKSVISTEDVSVLTKQLNSCKTIDDVLNLIDDKKEKVSIQLPAKKQEKMYLKQVKTLHWKKPIVVDNKCRYYADEIDWYIERHDSLNSNGGWSYFYSIFNSDGEIARYDKLKHAKNDMLNIIKTISKI